MSIRLHLTSHDLLNVRLSPGPSVLHEIQAAVNSRRPGGRRPVPVPGRPELDRHLGTIDEALGFHECQPGFLTNDATSEDETWHLVQATPAADALRDLADVHAQSGKVRRAQRRAVDPAGPDRKAILAAYRAVHRHLVRPYADAGQAALQARRRWTAHAVQTGGLAAILDGLGPAVVWRPPVLEVMVSSAVDLDVPLQGQGLTLYPTLYRVAPTVSHDEWTGLTTVTCPFGRPGRRPDVLARKDAAHTVMTALGPALGDSRAGLLAELARRPGRGTTALAERMGVAAGTTSDHLSALRRAGLVRTERRGPAVAHHLTELGWSLLSLSVDPGHERDR